MEYEFLLTKDESYTVKSTQFSEYYHSINGALQETDHVFIQAGLKHVAEQLNEINLLEIGLGTGLNCLATLQFIANNSLSINYHALEPFPMPEKDALKLHYDNIFDIENFETLFSTIHNSEEETSVTLSSNFTLTKHFTQLENFQTNQLFNLVYFDAFAPNAQPELWTIEIFEKLYRMMAMNGTLVTYCAKGQVKRNLKAAGFKIESLPGPIGKREMTRALKT